MLTAMNFVYQGLWAGPWLRDVAGLDDHARGVVLFTYACGSAAGSLLIGQAASFFQSRGHSPLLVPSIAMGALLAIQAILMVAPPSGVPALGLIWLCFAMAASGGPAGYAAVGQRFGPELAGRVATAINASMLTMVFLLQVAIGAILDLWPRAADGGWNATGYGWAMGLTLAIQGAFVLRAWRGRKLLGAMPT
jgi:MFS family permease